MKELYYVYSINSKSIIMVSAQSNLSDEIESVSLKQQTVYLKIDCDFRDRTDKACFYYSLDGKTWMKIGAVLQMAYTSRTSWATALGCLTSRQKPQADSWTSSTIA